MPVIKCQLSTTYEQLAKIFKSLETAAFEEGVDYGEDLTGCFKWFISPPALVILERRFPEELTQLQKNARFFCRPIPWQGHKGLGFEINLNL